jgi:saccharopine dehydrogenase-like NADP-dependent oxidoreductase
MRSILVIGAGRSSSTLIKYLLEHSAEENWKVSVCDIDPQLAERKVAGHPNGKAFGFDALNDELRRELIAQHDLIISMLPAIHHLVVVKDCLALSKNVITPSYINNDIRALGQAFADKGLLVLNEMGLDPGIDHMSAMKLLNEIRGHGGEIKCFESFTGGLIAPESDNNPWGYKFTWNPRNVVLAGQGGVVKFKHGDRYKYIPYHKLFSRTEIIDIEGYGKFEGYANRDSLNYREAYQLQHVPTIYRGTLRRPGFCRAWNILVQLGATDDSYVMEDTANMTYRQFINSFLAYNPYDSVELKLRAYLKMEHDDPAFQLIEWLGLFKNEPVGLANATPAQILQKRMEEKMNLEPGDKDMIVMWHKIGFEEQGEKREINSSLVVIGDDQTHTAMSKTVGLPLGIAAKLMLNGSIGIKGARLPIHEEIYEPVLKELAELGMSFNEKEVEPDFV